MASLTARLETYRDELVRWSKDKMQKGRRKYGTSWHSADPDYLLRRMEEEFYEFRQAVEHDRDKEEALEELADMVNFGLMYAVVSFKNYEKPTVSDEKWE